MVGFAGAIVVGMAAGNAEFTILYRAIGALFACYVIGWLVGSVGQRVIEENVAAYKRDHPIEDDPMKPKPQPAVEEGSTEIPSTSKRAA